MFWTLVQGSLKVMEQVKLCVEEKKSWKLSACVTDDNSRDEDPAKIRHDILLHCPDALEIGGRREAIEKGVDIAYNEGMILLVAGKGNEKFQIIGNQTFEFSDVEVIKNHALTY
ncbi:UDP-N-acetylmuramoylalanyl-D-glutamate-2, 6-diaminopimelate ligase [Wolbachia endosymbiont of Drosophila ananassae]|nr:UDP-N-acetylmuramoylalanyl-D-glutamate-2, 6-diaminopimelate ligase [Wolbachia endosymbiont of Drosophila ananassae]